MKVFVTGASGHIGSAVVPELLGHGHTVLGLARSDASAAQLEAAGAEVVRGDLDDLDVLRAAAAESDGVIHLAYRHDLMAAGDMDRSVAVDRAAIDAIGDALADSGKPLVGTTGTLMLAMLGITGRAGTEDDHGDGGGRVANENAVIALADRGVRSSVVRLAPTVHSEADRHGFVPTLIQIARETGASGYVGDGANHWPAGHTLDSARLFRLALESAPAGQRLHANDEEGIPFRDIAAAIGEQLDVPVESREPEHFRFLGRLVSLDNRASSAKTRALLGWEPTHPGLLEDLRAGFYFDTER
ncbi:MAG TPA: SDR family oxidoreductase [Baekduia sp.]|uniref:SDR family oxidoreductase n=1 Tax=Baekduia sp. TaxID=2600305 RepID=UPI002D7826B2|nr:SDR family oxidoreductase [Baekduia sp.]HET6510322.1 SDR family oxidoreductase [Baekduia sp.]